MQQKFLALDGLRGIAALAIAIFHVYSTWPGYLAVDFFLVLSGFVLSHNYLYRDTPIGFAAFLSRRLARLYPLHIFTLATWTIAFYMVSGVMPQFEDGTLYTFLQELTMLHNVGLNPTSLIWNAPSWSISVEFWLNILFFLCIFRTTSSFVLLLLAVAGLVFIYFQSGHLALANENYFQIINAGLIRGAVSFFLGILAYRAWLACRADERFYRLMPWLELPCIVAIVFVMLYRDDVKSSMDMLAPFIFLITVVVFACEKGILSIWTARLRYLGEISYSIYLNHITIMLLMIYVIRHILKEEVPIPPGLDLLAIYIGVLLVYSHFTYQYVEKPLRARYRDALPEFLARRREKDLV